MILNIESDHARFKEILRGKVKQDLRKYITRGELIGRRGKELVSIPIPSIEIPRFRFDIRRQKGVGQGDGEIGTSLGPAEEDGHGKAGDAEGQHILEVEMTLDELAEMLGEELELPHVLPKGKMNITSEKEKYTGIRQSGPESLRHFKRTYRAALRRQIISGAYNFTTPLIIPVREDKRYRSWKSTHSPESNAIIIYIMDVSGSMGDEQKEIVRTEAFWIDTWLRHQYHGLESQYIIHDAVAHVVDEQDFYHTRESGGTMISSAYTLCNALIDRQFPPIDWNIYVFHFSDGDNWEGDDTAKCLKLLEEDLLPKCNLFCYGQVESVYGSGEFIEALHGRFTSDERLVTSEIENPDAIYDSIKKFLGKGK
ncbi:MAG: DUF444 family protein [Planctomycetes bacterium]|nr:DUF444 family protein [Planctomycetota bacterium]